VVTLDFKAGQIGDRQAPGGDGYRDKTASHTAGQPGTVNPNGEQTSLGARRRRCCEGLLPGSHVTISGLFRERVARTLTAP